MSRRSGLAAAICLTIVPGLAAIPRLATAEPQAKPAATMSAAPQDQRAVVVAQAPRPIPLVLLRRSAKKAPNGSGDDVLVPADLSRDEIAKRVARLVTAPDGYVQLVLRLDRAAKRYLAADPLMQGPRRAALAEPAYLFLSDRQGGFPAEQFWLEMPDGSLREKRDVPFVDTVVGERDLVPGSPDGVEAIYAHELSHLIMAALAGPAPRRASSGVHFVTVRTDAWTAFVEGYGEHVQPMSLDHYASASWQSSRNAPLQAAIADGYARFVREQREGCWICPANLQFLRWHGRGEEWLRDGPITGNQFILQPALPADMAGDRRPPVEVQMYRDVILPSPNGTLKNGAQMIESEGVIATLFYRIASDPSLRGQYRDAAFYERFVDAEAGDELRARGPQAVVTPAENIYLKMFDVFHSTFVWADWPAVDFVKAYAKRFPDEAGAIYDVFLSVTRGVTVDREAKTRHTEPGYLAGLRDRLLAESVGVDANLGAPLWVAASGFRVGMGMFRYVPVPSSFTADLNAADVPDLRSLPGVNAALAEAIIRKRDAVGSFRSIDDLADVPGITPDLLAEFREMRASMKARMERQEPRRTDANWMKDYLALMVKGTYTLAAVWQYGRALALAGLVWALMWWGGGLLLNPRKAAVDPPPGRKRRWRRKLKPWARGCAVAAVPGAVAVSAYASDVLPTALNMAGAGILIAVVWQSARIVAGRDHVRNFATHARTAVALTAASIVIGSMY